LKKGEKKKEGEREGEGLAGWWQCSRHHLYLRKKKKALGPMIRANHREKKKEREEKEEGREKGDGP